MDRWPIGHTILQHDVRQPRPRSSVSASEGPGIHRLTLQRPVSRKILPGWELSPLVLLDFEGGGPAQQGAPPTVPASVEASKRGTVVDGLAERHAVASRSAL